MNLRLLYRISGYLSLLVGIAAAMCIYKPALMFYGIVLSILGFVVGGINIFLNVKYFWEAEKLPKGYIGIFLSSLPVLFLLFLIIRAKH